MSARSLSHDSQFTGILTAFSDISLLKAFEARYRCFVEQTEEGFYRFESKVPIPTALPCDEQIAQIYDHMYVTERNDVFARMYGLSSAQEITGRRLEELHGGRDVPENLEVLRSFIAAAYRTIQHETKEVGQEEDVRWFLSNAVGIVEGECRRVVWGTQRDITERKRAEGTLRQGESRFRTLFAESPVALFEWDFSEVKREMDALRAAGITDLDTYFEGHPDVLHAWIGKIRLLDLNRAAVELVGASTKEELAEFFRWEGPDPTGEGFRPRFVQLFAGRTEVEHERQVCDVKGDTLYTKLRLMVIPEHEASLDQVLVSLTDVTKVVRARMKLEASYEQMREPFNTTVLSLAASAEVRAPYTAGHQQRAAEVEGLRITALVHELGKTVVPMETLSKPGKLNKNETVMVQGHVQASRDVLKGIEFPWPVAATVLQHHERMDGSGYPQGLKGEEISLGARILAVADVVEAMSSHRPYRPALGLEAAPAEIEAGKGSRYGPAVVDACLAVFRQGFAFPPNPLTPQQRTSSRDPRLYQPVENGCVASGFMPDRG